MIKQRRILLSKIEKIVLRGKIKEIDKYLESAIRNSSVYEPIGGGTIDDLVEHVKKQDVCWKVGFLATISTFQESKIAFLESKVEELCELLDCWNKKANEALDDAGRLLIENENKDNQIEVLKACLSSFNDALKVVHNENQRLQEEVNSQKQKPSINVEVYFSSSPFSNGEDSKCALSEASEGENQLEHSSEEKEISSYERALYIIMKCQLYFKGKNAERFTKKYGALFDIHPEFNNQLSSCSFDKLVCQMLGAMVDEGYFKVSDYNSIATLLAPNDKKTIKKYAKYMGLAKKENAPYMIKEWKKTLKQ